MKLSFYTKSAHKKQNSKLIDTNSINRKNKVKILKDLAILYLKFALSFKSYGEFLYQLCHFLLPRSLWSPRRFWPSRSFMFFQKATQTLIFFQSVWESDICNILPLKNAKTYSTFLWCIEFSIGKSKSNILLNSTENFLDFHENCSKISTNKLN